MLVLLQWCWHRLERWLPFIRRWFSTLTNIFMKEKKTKHWIILWFLTNKTPYQGRFIYKNVTKEFSSKKTNFKRCFIEVGLLPSKKSCFICLNESPLKMMKDVFNVILKALFVLKIFKFSSWLFGQVEKTAWLEGKI